MASTQKVFRNRQTLSDKRAEDLDLGELLLGKEKKKTRSYTEHSIGTKYEFYLSGEIVEAEEYVEWFDVIRRANENDIVRIYINSPGGDLYTAIQFMRVLRESDATIEISVEGACMSAATIIFLCGDTFEITPHSLFMIHQYTSGYFGRGNHVRDQIKVESKWSEDLFRDIYSNFLTDAEIKAMIEGQDLWFTYDSVIERLKKKITADQLKLDSIIDEDDESSDESKP